LDDSEEQHDDNKSDDNIETDKIIQSCYENTNTDSHNNEDIVQIDVDTRTFKTLKSTIRTFPTTMLARLFENDALTNKHKTHYFFDRDPDCFASVLRYYRTKLLIKPDGIDQAIFNQEMEFWNITQNNHVVHTSGASKQYNIWFDVVSGSISELLKDLLNYPLLIETARRGTFFFTFTFIIPAIGNGNRNQLTHDENLKMEKYYQLLDKKSTQKIILNYLVQDGFNTELNYVDTGDMSCNMVEIGFPVYYRGAIHINNEHHLQCMTLTLRWSNLSDHDKMYYCHLKKSVS